MKPKKNSGYQKIKISSSIRKKSSKKRNSTKPKSIKNSINKKNININKNINNIKNKSSNSSKPINLSKNLKSKDNFTLFNKSYNTSNDSKTTNMNDLNDIINQEDIEDYINCNPNEIADDYCYYDDHYNKEDIDKVQIYGQTKNCITPISADSDGKLQVSANIIVKPITYIEEKLTDIITNNAFQYTHTFDVSQNIRESFIVQNHSKINWIIVQLQSSPDNKKYQIDLPEVVVNPDSLEILTPTRFIRYFKLAYRSRELNKSAEISVFFQAQGNMVDI